MSRFAIHRGPIGAQPRLLYVLSQAEPTEFLAQRSLKAQTKMVAATIPILQGV